MDSDVPGFMCSKKSKHLFTRLISLRRKVTNGSLDSSIVSNLFNRIKAIEMIHDFNNRHRSNQEN